MLGVRNEDIKDQKLQAVVKEYSLSTSQKITGVTVQGSGDVKMGEYLKKLDYLEFDTGKYEDDSLDENFIYVNAQQNNWGDWWQTQERLSSRLK